MSLYIFPGRFQPFHQGHMQVFEKACNLLKNDDILVLAVVSPFMADYVADEGFAQLASEHHLSERNPWNVCVPMMAISQVAKSSSYYNQIITTLIPRPELGWRVIEKWFPGERTWIVPLANESFDEHKTVFFGKLNDAVIRLEDNSGVSGRELRELYAKGHYDEFMSYIPDCIGDTFIKSHF